VLQHLDMMIHIGITQLEAETVAISSAIVHQKDLNFRLLKFGWGVEADKIDKQKILLLSSKSEEAEIVVEIMKNCLFHFLLTMKLFSLAIKLYKIICSSKIDL